MVEVKKILMPPYLDQLYNDLEENLERIEREEAELVPTVHRSIQTITEAVELLRDFVNKNSFQTEVEEIYFFKFIKPAFFSRLIYYVKLLDLETRKPAGSEKLLSRFINNELKRLGRFFDRNLEFYQYYRSSSSHLDKSYFLRSSGRAYYTVDFLFLSTDPQFNSSHDLNVAFILANEYLIRYLNTSQPGGDKIPVKPSDVREFDRELHWSDSKTDLIELIYALQSKGSINHGRMDVKQIAGKFEEVLNIDLGNYYKTFQEIRIRKKGRTNFLDQLKEKVIQRMDESDENGRGS